MKRRSIRRSLLVGIALVQLTAAMLATTLVIRHERRSTYRMLDASLVDRAATLKSVIEPPDDPVENAILHSDLLTLPKRDVYQLTQSDGKIIASSGLPAFQEASPRTGTYFIDQPLHGRPYRFYVEHAITIFDEDAKDPAHIPKLNLVYGTPLGGADENVQLVTWTSIGIALLLLALSLLATLWVVREGMRPVTDLAACAALIDAASLKWDNPQDKDKTQELEPLSAALESLVTRLRESFERERQFSADAAHEMKTAVAIVKSTLQLALERAGQPTALRQGVEQALEDVERMQVLVSGMLQLAAIEGLTGSASASRDRVDVNEQIAAAVGSFESLLASRAIRMKMSLSDQAITVQLPAGRLQLVLKNLLDNAIHYSPAGSTIHVVSTAANGLCAISIRDEGCGIEPEALPHIFERFYRGDASRSRESGGVGIGLAIVQAAIHNAGGTVTASSIPGSGSTFTVTLPAGLSSPSPITDH